MIDQKTLEAFLEKIAEKKYRLKQIYQAFTRELVGSWDEITVLPLELREKLAAEFSASSLEVIQEIKSKDQQTTKTLFVLEDGKKIEGVLLEHHHRTTVCISTQIGCPNKCDFCATGKLGFTRNLTSGEIVDQVLYFARELKKQDKRINNVVLMGMGEPLLNYDNVLTALDTLNDPQGFGLGARHFTISTSGVIPGIERLAEDNDQYYLAVSLHAPNQEIRASIMPIARKYPLDELMATIDDYTEKTHNRIFYEYTLIKGVNDSIENAEELSKLLKGRLAHINLIRCHEGAGYAPPDKKTIERFKAILDKNKISNTLRISMGEDIAAACGQLAGN